jgi:hypothetical protein
MTALNFQAFLDLDAKLEGIISLLASRSHDWDSWKITSERTWDSSTSQVTSERLEIEILRPDGNRIRESVEKNFSPSELVFKIFSQAGGKFVGSSLSWSLPSDHFSVSEVPTRTAKALGNSAKYLIRREVREFQTAALLSFFFSNQEDSNPRQPV